MGGEGETGITEGEKEGRFLVLVQAYESQRWADGCG